jgi:hypothetical protein
MTDAENVVLSTMHIIGNANESLITVLRNDGNATKQRTNLMVAKAQLSMAIEQLNKFKLD